MFWIIAGIAAVAFLISLGFPKKVTEAVDEANVPVPAKGEAPLGE